MSITTEELKKLLAEASPGPFHSHRNGSYWQIDCKHHDQIGDTCASNSIYPDGSDMLPADDAEKIAAANAKLFALSRDLAKRVIAAEKLVEALRFAHGWRDAQDMSHIDFRLEVGKRAEAALSEWEAPHD